jgi:hypothetical protein
MHDQRNIKRERDGMDFPRFGEPEPLISRWNGLTEAGIWSSKP